MNKRKAYYAARIETATGRRKLNEAVDYLRAATSIERVDAVVAELVGIADREGDRK